MTTHFDSRLSDRDFASHLLHVCELLEWAKSKRLHLKTTPPVTDFEFIQVEALLSAIERNANNLTPNEALEIVLNDPVLRGDPIFQKYPDDIDPSTCQWLLGAEAHRKWRELLSGAITAHELTLLDFGSKLPIRTAPATDTATTAPVVAVGVSGGVEPDKAGPVDKGWIMKKGALIKKYAHQWDTIQGDFHSASENGLSKAAKAHGHGEWYEAAALNWADQRGKRTKEDQQVPVNSVFNLAGKKHTTGG